MTIRLLKILIYWFSFHLFVSELHAQMQSIDGYHRIKVKKDKAPLKYYWGYGIPKKDTSSIRNIEIHFEITGLCDASKPYGFIDDDSLRIIDAFEEYLKVFPDADVDKVLLTYWFEVEYNINKPKANISIYFPCSNTFINFKVKYNHIVQRLVGYVQYDDIKNKKNYIRYSFFSRKAIKNRFKRK